MVVGLLMVGCGPDDEPEAVAPPTVPELSASEIERGRDACRIYAERVCRCADEKPELATECELARARPGALEMTLEGAEGQSSARDTAAIRVSARQIIRSCIEADAKLDPAICPRASASP